MGVTKYFNNLNYTMANEDTAMELAMLPENAGHVLSVAGSGGRILPLLAKSPKKVTCADISPYQLYLTELRFESLRRLERGEFLAFWGYPPRSASSEERRALFESLALSKPAKKFLKELFAERGWQSVLYDGKWERTFRVLSQVNRRFTGLKGVALFDALTMEEQLAYLESGFPRRAWDLAVLTLGNAAIFNALLYKGSFPKKNMQESFFGFYRKAFQRLFKQGLVRENFFLELLFFGKVVHTEGCPIECAPEVFARAKAALSDAEIRYIQGDVLETAKKAGAESFGKIDFFSFSDVPSYFSGETERQFLAQIRDSLNPGAQVVVRNYLHVPENVNTRGYEVITDQYEKEIALEKVQVYLVDVYRRTE